MAAFRDVIRYAIYSESQKTSSWCVCIVLLALKMAGAKEYCQLESFEASCPDGSVVLMQRALYGRMRIGRCLSRDYYVGCAADVIGDLDAKCSGRRHCRVPLPDHSLQRALACPSDLVAYLEADYTCITGENASPNVCASRGHVTLTSTSGYLMSEVTHMTGVGSDRCPWIIVARPGQNIRVTLFDVQPASVSSSSATMSGNSNAGSAPASSPGSHFSSSSASGTGGHHHRQTSQVTVRNTSASGMAGNGLRPASVDSRCILYATIRDRPEVGRTGGAEHQPAANEFVLCSSGGTGLGAVGVGVGTRNGWVGGAEDSGRHTVSYTSQTSSVSVSINYAPGAIFILRYEVVGCADPVLPATSSAHFVRRGDQVDIFCNYTGTSGAGVGGGDSGTAGLQRLPHNHQQQQQPQQTTTLHSWHLVCHQTQWIGDYGNCTNGVNSVSSMESPPSDESPPLLTLSYGLWFAVAAGLFLGITIGCSLLLLVCLKRQSVDKDSTSATMPTTTVVPNDLQFKYAPYWPYQYEVTTIPDTNDEDGSSPTATYDVTMATSKLPPPPPIRRTCAVYAYHVDPDVAATVAGLTATGSGGSATAGVPLTGARVHRHVHCACGETDPVLQTAVTALNLK